uniref:Uncharacterized protein n=1 Tax=Knipowitschia caucasica TaxID=637954 RepID=A0AAV2IUQ1_KNICA
MPTHRQPQDVASRRAQSPQSDDIAPKPTHVPLVAAVSALARAILMLALASALAHWPSRGGRHTPALKMQVPPKEPCNEAPKERTATSASSNSSVPVHSSVQQLSVVYAVAMCASVAQSVVYAVAMCVSVAQSVVYAVAMCASVAQSVVYAVAMCASVAQSVVYAVAMCVSVAQSVVYAVAMCVSVAQSVVYAVAMCVSVAQSVVYAVAMCVSVAQSVVYAVAMCVSVAQSVVYTVAMCVSLVECSSVVYYYYYSCWDSEEHRDWPPAGTLRSTGTGLLLGL